jgi:hypothetical protein
MSQTRADLDRKLSQLEGRAREMTPRRYAQRVLPAYFVDRAVGGILTLVGLRMAWRMYRSRTVRRDQVRAAMISYGRW